MVKNGSAILMTGLNENPVVDPRAVLIVAQKAGRSPFAIMWEMLKGARGSRKMRANEYLTYGIWRSHLTAEQRAAYLSLTGNKPLNNALSSPDTDRHSSLFADKFMTGLVLRSLGLRVPQTRAVYAEDAGFGGVAVLRDAQALADYMLDSANQPFFAKPVIGSRALGSVSVISGAGEGRLRLGDGREVAALDLAKEVALLFPRGWLIQELLQSNAAIKARTGPALATLRIVTVWGSGQSPEAFYAVWRLPTKGAMSDGAASGENALGLLDMVSGQILRVRFGDYLTGKDITHSLFDPELALIGFEVPGWTALLRSLCNAHAAFPGYGLLGWDVGITEAGPVVNEINTSPLHMLFQRARDEPFLMPERKALLEDIRAGVAARLAKAKKHLGTETAADKKR